MHVFWNFCKLGGAQIGLGFQGKALELDDL